MKREMKNCVPDPIMQFVLSAWFLTTGAAIPFLAGIRLPFETQKPNQNRHSDWSANSNMWRMVHCSHAQIR